MCEIGHPIDGDALPFPHEPSPEQVGYVDVGGFPPREQEAVIIADACFSPQSPSEIIDINIEPGGKLKRYLNEHWSWIPLAKQQSPFKDKPFTDASSTKFMLRRSIVRGSGQGRETDIRTLEA